MKYKLTILLTCILFASCSDSFINHELKTEKAGDCGSERPPIKMISNINGERYEFSYCVEDGFDGKNYKVERKGDSLLVSFPGATASKKAMYKMTLDIDAKPAYHHILLGDKVVEVIPAER
jgi:hypothetical protein